MKKISIAALCVLVAASLVACEGGKKAEPTKPASTAAATAKADGSAAADEGDPKMDNMDIPTPEGYEDEAEKKVTADNAEAELGAIEKAMDEDKE